jgi:hypothetical protein
LLAAAQEWLQRTAGQPGAERIATGAPECAWCPVCQLILLLRGDRLDLSRAAVTERLGDVQSAVAALLRALADAAAAMGPMAAPAGQPAPADAASAPPPRERPAERVQRIDLTSGQTG